jgi:uncharacterized protein YeaO (DUF488 family)
MRAPSRKGGDCFAGGEFYKSRAIPGLTLLEKGCQKLVEDTPVEYRRCPARAVRRVTLSLGPMAIFIVQLGTPRKPGEGLRIGTVRRPPRGVPKKDFARLNYYDVWFPNLSPTAELVQQALHASDAAAWTAFKRKFRREMSEPDRSRELDLLAALSHYTNLTIGCYCTDESRCHRSILRELLAERGAELQSRDSYGAD